MTRALAWIGLVVIAGCSGPTELVVLTDSDLAVPGDVDEIVLHIAGPSGDQHTRRGPLTGRDALRLPLRAVLLHEGGALGPVTIRVLGRRNGAEVVHADAIARFVPGRSVLVPVELASACVDGDCVAVQPTLDAGTDEGAENDHGNGRGHGRGHGRWSDDDEHDDDEHEHDEHDDDEHDDD